MNICVFCGACDGRRRRHDLRRRYDRTFRLRLIDAGQFAMVQCAIMWPAKIKGTGATFAVSIKAETSSSSPGRTDSAWSSAWRVSATRG